MCALSVGNFIKLNIPALLSTEKTRIETLNRREIHLNLIQLHFVMLALCMVALLPVLFSHCYANMVDTENASGIQILLR